MVKPNPYLCILVEAEVSHYMNNHITNCTTHQVAHPLFDEENTPRTIRNTSRKALPH